MGVSPRRRANTTIFSYLRVISRQIDLVFYLPSSVDSKFGGDGSVTDIQRLTVLGYSTRRLAAGSSLSVLEHLPLG